MDKCKQEWAILEEKILVVIIDNKSNIEAAFKATPTVENVTSTESEPEEDPSVEYDTETDDQR